MTAPAGEGEPAPTGLATRRAPILVRLVSALVGYAAACLIAGFVVLAGIVLSRDVPFDAEGVAGAVAASSPFLVGLLSVFVAVLAALPAAIGILLAEIAGIRSLFYYTLGGGLVAGLGYHFSAAAGVFPLTEIDQRTSETILLTVAGLAAGFAYWAVTGRRAGMAASLLR